MVHLKTRFQTSYHTNFTLNRVLTDLDAPKGAHLMGHNEEGSLNIVTLLLTGRSTPYLHNGVIYVGDEDHYVRIIYFSFINLNSISDFPRHSHNSESYPDLRSA